MNESELYKQLGEMGLIYPLAVKDAVPCIAPGGAELIRDLLS